MATDQNGGLHVVTTCGPGRIWSRSWTSSDGWHEALPIDLRQHDYHATRIAATEGNRLHVVYEDHEEDSKIWYSTQILPLPPESTRMFSVPVDPDDGWSLSAATSSLTENDLEIPEQRLNSFQYQASKNSESRANSLSGLGPALLLVVLVIGGTLWLRRKA